MTREQYIQSNCIRLIVVTGVQSCYCARRICIALTNYKIFTFNFRVA
jgi:hypothetical protein